jgi:hypothetical protein
MKKILISIILIIYLFLTVVLAISVIGGIFIFSLENSDGDYSWGSIGTKLANGLTE